MKFLTRVLAACILAGSVSIIAAAQPRPSCDFSSITEYRRYEAGGQWIVYLIPPKLKRECLISFVEKTHQDMPTTRFELFDSKGPELDAYIVAAEHDLNDAYYYPEKWVEKHQIASLYAFATSRGPLSCDWSIMFEKNYETITIGRGPCKA